MQRTDDVISLSSLIKTYPPLLYNYSYCERDHLTRKINCLDWICSIWGSIPRTYDMFQSISADLKSKRKEAQGKGFSFLLIFEGSNTPSWQNLNWKTRLRNSNNCLMVTFVCSPYVSFLLSLSTRWPTTPLSNPSKSRLLCLLFKRYRVRQCMVDKTVLKN